MIINILNGEIKVIFSRGDSKSLTHLIQYLEYLHWLKIFKNNN